MKIMSGFHSHPTPTSARPSHPEAEERRGRERMRTAPSVPGKQLALASSFLPSGAAAAPSPGSLPRPLPQLRSTWGISCLPSWHHLMSNKRAERHTQHTYTHTHTLYLSLSLRSGCTVRVDSLPHRKWRKIKQQPSMLPGPAVPGCC